MKSKKIVLTGLCMMLATLILSACAEKSQTAEPNRGTEPVSTVETVYGKVTDATMATVTLTAEDGISCTIARDDDTAVHSGNGILVDDYVQVVYTGSLVGGSAVAKSIVVSSETDSAPAEMVEAVYGKVIDATMATVTLTAEDGSPCTIARDDDTVVHSGNGILVDDYVQVVYTGSLAGGSAVAKSIVVSSETGEKIIRGTVQDAANASLTVLEDGSGKTVQIVKTDDTIQTVSNNVGDRVEVTYQDVTGDGYPIALEIK